MLIAIPASGHGSVSESFGDCATVCFFEDDHGRITRAFSQSTDGRGIDAILRAIGQYGVDAVVCKTLTKEEAQALAESGVLISAGANGNPQDAALAYLSSAVASDPNNNCRVCKQA